MSKRMAAICRSLTRSPLCSGRSPGGRRCVGLAGVIVAFAVCMPSSAFAETPCRAFQGAIGSVVETPFASPGTRGLWIFNPSFHEVNGLLVSGGPCKYLILASETWVKIENGSGERPLSGDFFITYTLSPLEPNPRCENRIARTQIQTTVSLPHTKVYLAQALEILSQPRRPAQLQSDGTFRCVPVTKKDPNGPSKFIIKTRTPGNGVRG